VPEGYDNNQQKELLEAVIYTFLVIREEYARDEAMDIIHSIAKIISHKPEKNNG
jgi:hypothetical protein